jgi:hypothetical protein
MILKNVKKRNYLLLLLISVTAFSCVSTNSLLIDIPNPSPKELPPAVQSLAIVSQTVDQNYTNVSSDSLQKLFYKQRFDMDTVIYDFQMADTTLKALGELLFESGRYDFVIPKKRFIEPAGESGKPSLLSWDKVENLTQSFDVDAVLSLDHLKTRIKSQYDNKTYYDPYQNGFYSASVAEMKIYYEALFRVYYPENKSVLLSEWIRDTLLWEDADHSARLLFQHFTPVKQALTETGIAVALELSDKIAVKWHTERRKYFAGGNKNIQRAAELLNTGECQKAVTLLKETIENTNSESLKSKAQFNIAVCYEILGNLDKAVYWALESYDTQYRPLTYEYLEILRRKEKERLTREKSP